MATEVIRCSDCGAVFKAVPNWLATAKVNFTCTSCPRRASRSSVRFEPAVEPARVAMEVTRDVDLDGVEIEDLDDDVDLDLGDDDLDGMKDDKDL